MLPVFAIVTGASAMLSAWQSDVENNETNKAWLCRNNTAPACEVPHRELLKWSGAIGFLGGMVPGLLIAEYGILSSFGTIPPDAEKWWLVGLGGVASASALLAGGWMTYYEGFGETWKKGAGITALSLGVATAAITTIAAFEPVSTGGNLHVSLVPIPNGLAVFGRF
jgi:hypothetical protein